MGGREKEECLTLLESIEPDRWQRLQEHLTGVLGVPLRTVSPSHDLLVAPSWPTGLSPEIVIDLLKVGEELDALLPHDHLPLDTSSLTTLLGVTYAVVPIHRNIEEIAAYFVVGPMIVGPRENEMQFRERVSAQHLDPQALWPVLVSLKLFTFVGIRSVLNLVEDVGTSLMQLAAEAKQMSVEIPVLRLAPQPVEYYTQRVFQALLEAATRATHADGGSVMSYDADGQTLMIQAAQGLEREIVQNTRLHSGEGIASLAAQRQSILLIDEQIQDEEIRNRMQHPEIYSSLIAPLITQANGRKPIGVLNLRSQDSKRRFTQEDIPLLRSLLDLASTALNGLKV